MSVVHAPDCGIGRRTTLEDDKMQCLSGFTLNTIMGGATPLMLACHAGRVDVMKALLLEGANVNDVEDAEECTAMHLAASANNVKAIELLLDFGASVSPINCWGSTPLHWAAGKGNIEAIKILVANGADVGTINKHSETPLTRFEATSKRRGLPIALSNVEYGKIRSALTERGC